MAIHPLAGKPAPIEILINVEEVERAYYERVPDINNPHERVSFGTSGHRGSPLDGSLNEAHILAITQAICEIGRASCRERVEISVVAVSLKKKKDKRSRMKRDRVRV